MTKIKSIRAFKFLTIRPRLRNLQRIRKNQFPMILSVAPPPSEKAWCSTLNLPSLESEMLKSPRDRQRATSKGSKVRGMLCSLAQPPCRARHLYLLVPVVEFKVVTTSETAKPLTLPPRDLLCRKSLANHSRVRLGLVLLIFNRLLQHREVGSSFLGAGSVVSDLCLTWEKTTSPLSS